MVGAVGLLVSVVPANAAAQTVLPGTTIGDNCTMYKSVPSGDTELIGYWRCSDRTTAKIVTYEAKSGELFQYTEFRDANNNLTESRFIRLNSRSDLTITPLSDSQTP
jgi:hypothetical protein